MVAPQEFLRHVWGDTKGFAEVTVIGTGKPPEILSFPFIYPDSVDSLVGAALKHNRNRSCYFGVALRRERWPRPLLHPRTRQPVIDPKTGKPKMEHRGTEDNAHSVRCVWADVDFAGHGHKGKVVAVEDARRLLKECPLQPSIVVATGGGIQVYWLLREPVYGDDLWRAKAVNARLKEYLGGDPTGDLARIFRIPGTVNVKYKPPRECKVVHWAVELEYSLDDFDVLSPPDPDTLKPQEPLTGPRLQSAPPPKEPVSPGRRGVITSLSNDTIEAVKKNLAEIWLMGWRHRLALYFGGLCAHAGVPLETAQDVVKAVSDFNQGDTGARLKDVESTYSRFQQDRKIAGGPALEKMIMEEFPPLINQRAKKIFDLIRKAIPKPPGRGRGGGGGGKEEVEPDFDIVRIVKFDSRPARYHVTIQKHDEEEEFTVECETPVFTLFNRFHQAFIEATPNRVLAPITNRRWHLMLQGAPLETREAPEEARAAGIIANELDQFLQTRKENPELGELRAYAGYDDKDIYFLLGALKGRLRDQGSRPSEQQLIHTLKELGWEPQKRRFGERTARVWYKSLVDPHGNGNGNGNGSAPHEGPDLFPEA